jgi:RND family efflux transporter MFP subunit
VSVVPLVAAGCGARTAPLVKAGTAPRPIPVTVAELVHRPVERVVETVGTLRGWEQVTVGSKRPGRVVRIVHDMGDRVRPGEPLVELDTRDADLAIDQAEKQFRTELAKLGLDALPGQDFDPATVSTVAERRVAVERARRNLAIQRGLLRENAGIRQDFANAESDADAAVTALDSAIVAARATLANARAYRAALEVAKQTRADMVIRAPRPSLRSRASDSAGYAVTKRTVADGQMLKEGEAVFDLVIEDPLRLWSNVPERFSGEVRVGQRVRVRAAAGGEGVFAGEVARVNPAIDTASRTFQVETVIPNGGGKLRPGGFAKASIVVHDGADATVVPLEAVVRFAGVTKVFVVDGGKAREIKVETVASDLEGDGLVEVSGSLPSRGRVIVTGQSQLADGTPVKVRVGQAESAQAGDGRQAPRAEPDA